jgi:hypothetical protein
LFNGQGAQLWPLNPSSRGDKESTRSSDPKRSIGFAEGRKRCTMSVVHGARSRQGRCPCGDAGGGQSTQRGSLVRIVPWAVHIDHVFRGQSGVISEGSQLRFFRQGEWSRSARGWRWQEWSKRGNYGCRLHAFRLPPCHDDDLPTRFGYTPCFRKGTNRITGELEGIEAGHDVEGRIVEWYVLKVGNAEIA